jgi:hypothetical protein
MNLNLDLSKYPSNQLQIMNSSDEEGYFKENDIDFCEECECDIFIHEQIWEDVYCCGNEIEVGFMLICDHCGHVVNEKMYGHFNNEKSEIYLEKEKNRIRRKKINNIID